MKFSILFRPMTAVLLGIVMGVGITPAFAVDHNGAFELEGNAMENDYPGDDWSTPPLKPDGSATAFTGIIVDRHESGGDDFYTGGKSKVPELIEDWQWKSSPEPTPKTDITNAYAANYNVWDPIEQELEQVVYFGADLYADNGDAELAFWFFQDDVAKVGLLEGDFTGSHFDGDVYLAVKFSNGGKIATGQVYEWDSSCKKAANNDPQEGQCAAKNIRLIINADNALCDPTLPVGPPSTDACVITNDEEVESPWDYTPKSGTEGWFPITTFFEGGINIHDVFGANKCFSAFMAMSGASTSFSSTAKDFALGDFDVCSVFATKRCDNDDDTDDLPYDLNFNVRGCAYNDGGGAINVTSLENRLPITNIDTEIPADLIWYLPPASFDPATDCSSKLALAAVTGTFETSPTGTLVSDPSTYNLGVGEALVYYFSESSTSINPQDEVTITAEGVGGTNPFSNKATAQCPDVNFPASLEVVKACTADLEVDTSADKVVVRINVTGQVCNTGDIELTDLTLFDTTPLDETVYLYDYSTTLAPDECTDYNGHYYPNSIPGGNICPFEDQVTAIALSDGIFTRPDSPGCTRVGEVFECTAVSNNPVCKLRALDDDDDCATGPVNPE